MKKLFFYPISLLILTSCGNKQKEIAEDYLQTLGDSKVDLDINWERFEKIEDVTFDDSAKYYFKVLSDAWSDDPIEESRVKEIKTELSEAGKSYQNLLDTAETWSPYVRNEMRAQIEDAEAKLTQINYYIGIAEKYDQYKNNNDIILKSYVGSYSMFNPFLNTKQSRVDTFYFNPGEDKILKKN